MFFQKIKFLKIKYFIINIFFLVIVPPNLVYAQDINQSIEIHEIKIEGCTAFSSETIRVLVSPYINRKATFDQLRRVAQIITDLYVDQGYTTSGAYVPQQDITDGVVKIQVVEGKLENIEIEGLKHLKKSYIISGLRQVNRLPLNINELEQALEKFKLDPLIEKVEANLEQGTSRDSSVLILGIQEASLIEGKLIVDNHSPPSIGEIQGIAVLIHKNLLGIRDRAEFQYNLTEGLSSYELNYTIPVNYNGTAISLGYQDNESRITQDPFAQIDINAQADTISLKLIQEITRSQTEEFYVTVIFNQSISKTFIGDIPFRFADGTDDGLSRLSVFRLKGDWLKRSNKSVISLISQLSLGVDLFDTTVNDDAPDGLFLAWLGQLQFATALDKEQDIVFITRLSTQLAFDSLLPFEKIAVGGVDTVRGYPNNGFLGDNAVLGTFELGFTALEDEDLGRLKISPFLDVGTVWNTNDDFSQTLASLGLRIDWQFRDSLSLRLDLAIPLIDVEQRGDSLSDNGVSFSVQFSPF